ncbi:hypothetical protein NPX13_g11332 [Xylaria arbuscula]|uniref:Uncharacterized protein n=1 Tax=Xylaria arbuscula TaxID=114810 RepID=A0A9W8TFQ4_9PEZI|nr:hypothetical protein NPX13_g11332 [Xylaria arbuscula]
MACTGATSHGDSIQVKVTTRLTKRYDVASEYDGANDKPAEPGKGITGNEAQKKACVREDRSRQMAADCGTREARRKNW